LRAIQIGLYRQYCPDFEKEENNETNENEIKNSDQRKQNSLVAKWAGLLKSRAVYAAVVLTAGIKKQADVYIPWYATPVERVQESRPYSEAKMLKPVVLLGC
jgi:hypothetical protein